MIGMMILVGGLIAILGVFLTWYGSFTGWNIVMRSFEYTSTGLVDGYAQYMPLFILMIGVSAIISGFMFTIRPVKGGGLNVVIYGILILAAAIIFVNQVSSANPIGIGVWVCAAAGALLLVLGVYKTFKA